MEKSRNFKRFFTLLLSTIFTITQLITVPVFAATGNDQNQNKLLEVTPSLVPNRESNTYEVGESFDINYEIKPKDIDKEKYDDWYKSKDKKKEIVLVMDTSGSMNCPQKTDNKEYYYNIENWALISNNLNIKLSGFSGFHEVKMGAQFYIEIDGKKYYIEGNKCYKNIKEETRLNIAKNKAEEFINQFKDEKNVSIGLVSFASKIKVINPLTDDFSSVKKDIKQLKAGGGTNIGEALRKAHDMLNKSNNKETDKYIVLMTDGFPTAFTLLDYKKSIQEKNIYYYDYWFKNPLGFVESDYKEICEFVNINNPKFKEGFDFKNQHYAVNYGDNDLNNYALQYSKEVGRKIKQDNIGSFIIGFSEGANSEKLSDIAKATGGEYREAADEEALKNAYDNIGTKIKAPMIKNLEFQVTIPKGLEIQEIKDSVTNEAIKPIKIDDTTYYINLQDIIYNFNKDDPDYYFSKNKNIKLKLKCLQKGEHEIISFVNKKENDYKKSICNKSIKVNVIKNSIVELKQQLCSEQNNGYNIGDEIKINYNIKLKPVSNYSCESKDKKEQINNKGKKKIVLAIDTSGSMDKNISNIVFESKEKNISRLDSVKEVSKDFVDKFKDDENTEIAIVRYSGKADVVLDNSNKVFLSSKDNETIKKRINSLKADGGTNIGDGIRKSYSILDKCDKDSKKYMILMTDGVPTAYTCYARTIYYKYSRYDEKGYINYYNRKYYYSEVKGDFKLENDNRDEGYVIKFGDEYDKNALEYAKQAMQKSKSKNINNVIVGFSDGIDTKKLKEIAGDNAQYKEAKDLDELSKRYDEIQENINTIKTPCVSNLEFNLKLPKGLELVDDFSNNSNFKLQKSADNSSTIIGKINDVKYIKSQDGKTYIPERDNINFDIKVKITENKDYVLGENDNKATLSYKDLYGVEYTEGFTPTINIIISKLDIEVDKFGILKSISDKGKENLDKDNDFIKNYIQDTDIKIMNNFMYQVGIVIKPCNKSDENDEGNIKEDIKIKNSFSTNNNVNIKLINENSHNGVFLYELNGNDLERISNDKISVNKGEITIKGGTLKKGQQYIVTQGILFKNIESNTVLKDDIEINGDKTSKQITINKTDNLPNLD